MAALVAVLLSCGVLLGSGAMVIDVGALCAEKAQLQNGADAAALAVAGGCGKAPAYCSASRAADGLAGRYADANAADGTATVTAVCGHDANGILPATCPAPTGRPFDCGPTPPAGTTYAEVHTRTLSSTGRSVLPPAFGRALTGETGVGATACSRAAWGVPNAGDGLAMTISYCEWQAAIGSAGNPAYAPAPPTVPSVTVERVIYFHDTNPTPTHCTATPSGFDVPGDFGSTQTTSNTCTTRFNFDPTAGTTTYLADSGSSLPGPCQTALLNARSSHKVTFVPVYDKVVGGGSGGTYTLWRMAAFVVTGYYWPSWSANSWLTGKQPCKGSARCISGYFTTGVTTGGTFSTGQGAGATVLQLMR